MKIIEMSRTHPPLVPAVFDPEYRTAMEGALSRYTPSEMVGAHRWMGTEEDRRAGAVFTGCRLGAIPDVGRVVVTNGTQSAFNMLLGGLVRAGNALAVESLTYPPILVLAKRFGFVPKGARMDDEGIIPEALEDLCRSDRPKALYLLSTLQNPTTATMSLARRQQIVEVARKYDLQIIEDDIYSLLPEALPPPIAALAPERSWYMLGVAKTIAAGMKIAYVVAPTAARAEEQFWPGVRATFWMSAPISAAVSTQLIETGGAERIICAVRQEMVARHNIVRPLLTETDFETKDGALHVWIRLPHTVTAAALASLIRERGVTIGTADPYVLPGEAAPQAIRVGIGHAKSRTELEEAIRIIAVSHAEFRKARQ
ncbi:PLP-dependent aminotransferase family protein [Mesorhizobium sp. VK23B]|uniref:PLP-dependent aminotransferase family protein n=1 Tax=Mesorhizobium dulcispinae TaxID=3072316 RepID=A0ABU4XP76_9HYPH|nr:MULTISPECIES: PLP-dependent aminotransferase family protein [unclassified Mesorhizobium]MDX8470170.1 PLP-dependent aminotransferase family protein [Mesorhizobium sp. VK23B]MDX8476554.1 PLP-dependent aminotransferase family protein [Mesorhizobium sp. VK23A]